nr:unnamed protein product [Spirometra erinaceieuropaei]
MRLHINPAKWEDVDRDRPTWRRNVKTGSAIYEANRIATDKVKREALKSQSRPVRNCASRTTPTVVPPAASSPSSPLPTNPDCTSEPPVPLSSSTVPTKAAHQQQTHPRHNNRHHPTTSDSRGENQYYTCPHCDRTFTSHIRLVGHLRIHRIEADKPVHEAPTYTHRTRLHCPRCPRTSSHRMGLVDHKRIHEHL